MHQTKEEVEFKKLNKESKDKKVKLKKYIEIANKHYGARKAIILPVSLILNLIIPALPRVKVLLGLVIHNFKAWMKIMNNKSKMKHPVLNYG